MIEFLWDNKALDVYPFDPSLMHPLDKMEEDTTMKKI